MLQCPLGVSMFRFLFASAAVAALFSNSALAQSHADAASAGPAYDWSGLYIGMNLGWGFSGDSRWSVTPPCATAGPADAGCGNSFDIPFNGIVGGAQAGYNVEWNSFLLGLEGAIQGSGMQGSEQSKFNPPFLDDVNSLDVNWIGLASLRAGFVANRLLFYFKGGYAGAKVDARIDDNVVQFGDPAATTGKWSDRQWLNGYSIGGGAEFMVTPHVVVGADYQFVDLSPDSFVGNFTDGARTPFAADIGLQFQEVKGRLSFKF
jgi:outer membrane immunogenic protein